MNFISERKGRRFVFDLGETSEVVLASIKGRIPICVHKNHQLLNRRASICLQVLDRCTSDKLDSNISTKVFNLKHLELNLSGFQRRAVINQYNYTE